MFSAEDGRSLHTLQGDWLTHETGIGSFHPSVPILASVSERMGFVHLFRPASPAENENWFFLLRFPNTILSWFPFIQENTLLRSLVSLSVVYLWIILIGFCCSLSICEKPKIFIVLELTCRSDLCQRTVLIWLLCVEIQAHKLRRCLITLTKFSDEPSPSLSHLNRSVYACVASSWVPEGMCFKTTF